MERENSTVPNCFGFHLEAKDSVADEEFDFDYIPVQRILTRFQGELAPHILVWSIEFKVNWFEHSIKMSEDQGIAIWINGESTNTQI